MAFVKVGSGHWLDMTWLNIGNLANGEMTFANATRMKQEFGDGTVTEFFGSFTYNNNGILSGGALGAMEEYVNGQFVFGIGNLNVPVWKFIEWIEDGDTFAAESFMFAGNDQLEGADGTDALLGFAGNDSIAGYGGNDALSGMEGNDTIDGGYGDDFIVGMEGSDLILGGWGEDDVNGNMGADTVRGGDEADFVRGGKDNDIVYGDAGDDPHLNGNLGDDYVFGGVGSDTCYGGQGNDWVYGQEGADQLSGDVGADTLTGGAGGDRFLFGRGGGNDLITDFATGEGDKLRLAAGTTYTLRAEGGNTVVDIGQGETITLQGVNLSDGDWIGVG